MPTAIGRLYRRSEAFLRRGHGLRIDSRVTSGANNSECSAYTGLGLEAPEVSRYQA
jgi:hypothetical protein